MSLKDVIAIQEKYVLLTATGSGTTSATGVNSFEEAVAILLCSPVGTYVSIHERSTLARTTNELFNEIKNDVRSFTKLTTTFSKMISRNVNITKNLPLTLEKSVRDFALEIDVHLRQKLSLDRLKKGDIIYLSGMKEKDIDKRQYLRLCSSMAKAAHWVSSINQDEYRRVSAPVLQKEAKQKRIDFEVLAAEVDKLKTESKDFKRWFVNWTEDVGISE